MVTEWVSEFNPRSPRHQGLCSSLACGFAWCKSVCSCSVFLFYWAADLQTISFFKQSPAREEADWAQMARLWEAVWGKVEPVGTWGYTGYRNWGESLGPVAPLNKVAQCGTFHCSEQSFPSLTRREMRFLYSVLTLFQPLPRNNKYSLPFFRCLQILL